MSAANMQSGRGTKGAELCYFKRILALIFFQQTRKQSTVALVHHEKEKKKKKLVSVHCEIMTGKTLREINGNFGQ